MEFGVKTSKKTEVLDITGEISERVERGARAALIFVPHATAAVTINEYEQNLKSDLEKFYGKLAEGNWLHNRIDDNAEAHIISSLLKPFVFVPVENGRLVLGTWQRILFVELDGPRKRRVIVQML